MHLLFLFSLLLPYVSNCNICVENAEMAAYNWSLAIDVVLLRNSSTSAIWFHAVIPGDCSIYDEWYYGCIRFLSPDYDSS